jgi:hypothetical protein
VRKERSRGRIHHRRGNRAGSGPPLERSCTRLGGGPGGDDGPAAVRGDRRQPRRRGRYPRARRRLRRWPLPAPRGRPRSRRGGARRHGGAGRDRPRTPSRRGPSRGRDGAAAVGRRQLRRRLGHQRLPVRGPARRGRRRSGPRRPARRPGRGRHPGPPEDCEAAAYLGALGALLPPPPPGAPGPFALSQPGALASFARAPPGSSPRRKPVSRRSGSTRTRRRCCAGCSSPAPQLAPSRRPAKPACAMPSWRRSLPTAHQAVPTGCTTPSATPSRRTGEAAAIAWADRAGRGTIGA